MRTTGIDSPSMALQRRCRALFRATSDNVVLPDQCATPKG